MRIARAALAALTCVVLTLSACGDSEDDTDSSGGSEGAGGGPVSVTDARGETVTLDQPAENVVALEWAEVEELVALGVMPVGVADVGGFETWVNTVELDDDVTDVGGRSEPSQDAIASIVPEPDLIITETGRSDSQLDKLEEVATVLVLDGTDQSDNLGKMRENLNTIATLTGKEAEAEQLLADFDESIEQGKQALADAGLDGSTFAAAHGWSEGGSVTIRMFGEGSLFSDVAEQLGLTNAWQGEVDEWGLTVTDVEAMTQLGDTEFMYIAPEDNVFAEVLPDNPIWQGLPFVEDGNVHELDGGTWSFGGPKSCQQLVDEIVGALTS